VECCVKLINKNVYKDKEQLVPLAH